MTNNLPKKQIETIESAISVLEKAAIENKEQFKKAIGKDYKLLLETIDQIKPALASMSKEMLERSLNLIVESRDKITEASKDAALRVDEQAHTNPWAFVGGAFVAGGIIGLSLRRNSRN